MTPARKKIIDWCLLLMIACVAVMALLLAYWASKNDDQSDVEARQISAKQWRELTKRAEYMTGMQASAGID